MSPDCEPNGSSLLAFTVAYIQFSVLLTLDGSSSNIRGSKNTVESKTWLGDEFPDTVPEKSTINDWYAKFRRGERSTEDGERSGRPKEKKKVLLHQDNVPCHRSVKTMAKLHELGFELLAYPPSSPDLASSDYFLFSDLKRMVAGKKC
ncbi:hypothetical protein GWI33_000196 [Rhynchophorus ferrugineus]|uniref:Transposase n=1 Tax=Rhynchophorus ferrugineus TaxID=354439 RepID=A0A834J0E7_RHYFE|nr:hypothetical protein GWI33_000196 [Rhynchophorus ferrugineus]